MTLFDIFDISLIINLPARTDRKRETLKEIEFAGGEMAEGKIEFFPATRPESADGFPSIGAHGSLVSHLEALKKARDMGVRTVLLMEDDICFGKEIRDKHVLDTVAQALAGENWDFAYLGHNHPDKESHVEFAMLPHTGGLGLTHCVAFHQRVFDPFIDYLEMTRIHPAGHPEGGRMGFDGAINLYRYLHPNSTLVALPCIAFQRSSRTDLGKHKWYDGIPILREAATLARKIKGAVTIRVK